MTVLMGGLLFAAGVVFGMVLVLLVRREVETYTRAVDRMPAPPPTADTGKPDVGGPSRW